MSERIQVRPTVDRLINVISIIEKGKFKIPTFQRDFVWGTKEKIELFDSISKDYPIGSILLWKPNEEFKEKAEIGPYKIDSNAKEGFFYILDGFQRLSTLFGCLINPHKTTLIYDKEKYRKEFSMFYDLEDETFNMNVSKDIKNIPVYTLIDTYAFLDYCDRLRSEISDKSLSEKLISKAKHISSTIIDYSIPLVEIDGGSIEEAVNIFSRINSKGVTISPDWMLSALTSSEKDGFNLGEILGDLLVELEDYNFHYVSREVLIQCIQNSFGKVYFDQKIEDIAKRSDFIEVVKSSVKGIKKAVKFLFEELMVVDKRLLPYNNQLIFLSYFFKEVEVPSIIQIDKLKKWFWLTSYSNYFTIYSLSKIRLAFDRFLKFTKNEEIDPLYQDRLGREYYTADLPKSVSAKSVRSTTLILFMLNFANDFKKVTPENVRSFSICYLKRNLNSHSSAIPLIEFEDYPIDYPYMRRKSKDVSYLLDNQYDLDFLRKHFLNDTIRSLFKTAAFDDAFNERMKLILKEEKAFVDKLGINYVTETI